MPDTKGPKKGVKKKKGAGTDPTSIKGRRGAPATGLISQVAASAPGAAASAPGTRAPDSAGGGANDKAKAQSASGRAQSQSAAAKGKKGGGGGKGR
ncbi:hypothetical protein IT575_14070 [bacterium]|nr:hypothetical protein [bacterium]